MKMCTIIMDNNLNDIILVGHSYGGFVITGVGLDARQNPYLSLS